MSSVFTRMWNLRNLTEDRGGGEGEKRGEGEKSYKQRGREANHKRLLHTENKLRVDRGEGKVGDGH